MSRWLYTFLLVAVGVGGCSGPRSDRSGPTTQPMHDATWYEDAWRRVSAFDDAERPRSARDVVTEIYRAASDDGNEGQLVRALVYRLRYDIAVGDVDINGVVGDLDAHADSLGVVAAAVLRSVKGEALQQYLAANRYRLYNRTAVAGDGDATDIETWDIRMLASAILDAYRESIAEVNELAAAPADTFSVLLDGHPEYRRLRPSMLDLLAHRTLDALSNSELGLSEPEVPFVLSADEHLVSTNEFALLDIEPAGAPSVEAEVLRLFQALVRSHQFDADPSALVHTELRRLRYVRDQRLGLDGSKYLEALDRLLTDTPNPADGDAASDGTVSARADIQYAVAEELDRQGASYSPLESSRFKWSRRDAVETCRLVVEAYPATEGATNCRALDGRIRQQELQVESEGVLIPNEASLVRVVFRNLAALNIRAYRIDEPDARSWMLLNRRDQEAAVDALMAGTAPIIERGYTLPDDGDFQRHATEVMLPPLGQGAYVLVATPGGAADASGGVRDFGRVFVSNLSYFYRNDNEGAVTLHVVDRSTGTPMPGATVTPWHVTRGRQAVLDRRQDVQAGANGRVELKLSERQAHVLGFKSGSDWLYSETTHSAYSYARMVASEPVTRFFTDRAIYRPGQPIYFKGILLQQNGDRYVIRDGAETTVRFVDVNGREIASMSLRANAFGTVSGQFTAPQSGLTGSMTITDGRGAHSVYVEEYKRPRFEVVADEFERALALGDSIAVTGAAMSYAGAPVAGGSVTYRVTRRTYFPWWRGGRYGFAPHQPQAQIAHGTGITDSNGHFNLSFVARGDDSADSGTGPGWRGDQLAAYAFDVSVDVTDMSGETQSTVSTIRLGERSLVLALEPEGDVIDRARVRELGVLATTLDGAPVATSGRVHISRLIEPQALLRPSWQPVDTVSIREEAWRTAFPHLAYAGEDDPATWAVDSVVHNEQWTTDADSSETLVTPPMASWAPGMYRIVLEASDDNARPVSVTRHVRIVDTSGDLLPGNPVHWHHLVTSWVEPGEEAVLSYGSGAGAAILLETEVAGRIVDSKWVRAGETQHQYRIPIVEAHRGNIAVRSTMVRYGRLFSTNSVVVVPWSNKKLKLTWGTHRDILEPGEDETWTLRVEGPDGDRVTAEMLATLYDASLDVFAGHTWSLDVWPTNYGSQLGWNGTDYGRGVRFVRTGRFASSAARPVFRTFDQLAIAGMLYPWRYGRRGGPLMRGQGAMPEAATEVFSVSDDGRAADAVVQAGVVSRESGIAKAPPADGSGSDDGLGEDAAPPLRANFDETAFFFPQLRTDADGATELRFKMPESLTRWRFMALAHTTSLQTGYLEGTVVTQRELMITANMPRFLRQGDTITLTASVDNMSDQRIAGMAHLVLTDAVTEATIVDERVPFDTEAGGGAAVAWPIEVPDAISAVRYQVRADAESFSDGEESILPVLTDRVLVTESLPLPLRGPGTKGFRFDHFIDNDSPTIRHQRLFVEFTANPIWHAVQALPYLAEYPHECAEQVFARFYANGIASFLVDENPDIETIFDAWRKEEADALLSSLDRNPDLKAVTLEETPWVRQATSEAERKRRIAVLFDAGRIRAELRATLDKLELMQLDDGAWPWFGGGRSDRYITQHILKGLGSMRRIGIVERLDDTRPESMALRAVGYVDQKLKEDYDRLIERKANLAERHIGWIQLHALYARSFFPDVPVAEDVREAFEYYLSQLDAHALSFEVFGEGMAALALNRFGRGARADAIMISLREKAQQSDELGMYWSVPTGWWWYTAPIETQALLIEAFSEIAGDVDAVDAMQLWLLKQKQTQDWRTTKATTDAIYALLQRGTNLINNPGTAVVRLGDAELSSSDSVAERGTGYISGSWTGAAIDPALGEVEVTKTGPGPAWGAVYWQYFEDLDRVEAADTPLSLEKSLFVTTDTDAGETLVLIGEDALVPGDLVTVRVVLRSDRDMEYVHLKDMRASGFEPVDVLSGYRWRDGLGFYQSTRDAASHFFISYLPAGTHVFEYRLRVRHAGDFSNGIATVQSMYAPEFSAHSAGSRSRSLRKR